MLSFLDAEIERLHPQGVPDTTYRRVHELITPVIALREHTHLHVFCGPEGMSTLLNIQCSLLTEIFEHRVNLTCDFFSRASSDAEHARALGLAVRRCPECDVFVVLGRVPADYRIVPARDRKGEQHGEDGGRRFEVPRCELVLSQEPRVQSAFESAVLF